MNNEIAIAMLLGLFGWKVTFLYIGFGLLVAVVGGYLIGRAKMEKHILLNITPMEGELDMVKIELSFKQRVKEAWERRKKDPNLIKTLQRSQKEGRT